jgi:hypothetical protein
MSHRERWLGPILRAGLEARIDAADGEQRVIVYVDDTGIVQWTPVEDTYFPDQLPHRFRFWVHTLSEPDQLQAIQILAARLKDAGHTPELVTPPSH